MEAQYSKSLKEFRATEVQRMLEQHERNLSDAVEKLETKHERQLREQEEKHQSEVMTSSCTCPGCPCCFYWLSFFKLQYLANDRQNFVSQLTTWLVVICSGCLTEA